MVIRWIRLGPFEIGVVQFTFTSLLLLFTRPVNYYFKGIFLIRDMAWNNCLASLSLLISDLLTAPAFAS